MTLIDGYLESPCQNSQPSEWVGHFEPKFQGEGVLLGNIFWFLQN